MTNTYELFNDADFHYSVYEDSAISVFQQDRHKTLQYLHSRGWKLYARYADTKYANRRDVGGYLFHLMENPTDRDDCTDVSAILPDSHAQPIFLERAGVYIFKFDDPKPTKLDYIKIAFDKQ